MKIYKKIIVCLISNLFFSEKYIIASTGRAGSTILTDAIYDAWIKKNILFRFLVRNKFFRKNRLKKFIKNLNEIKYEYAPVIKTHDLIDKYTYNEISKYKIIFIYSSPIDSYFSFLRLLNNNLKSESWLIQHLENLKSPYNLAQVHSQDILNYKNQIEAWSKFINEDIFIINYSDLWSNVDKLSTFLSLNIVLPKKNKRKSFSLSNYPKIYDDLLDIYNRFNNSVVYDKKNNLY